MGNKIPDYIFENKSKEKEAQNNPNIYHSDIPSDLQDEEDLGDELPSAAEGSVDWAIAELEAIRDNPLLTQDSKVEAAAYIMLKRLTSLGEHAIVSLFEDIDSSTSMQ